jgi:hypothetical protein
MPSYSPAASSSRSPVLKSKPIGSLPSSLKATLMIPPPPAFADYMTERRGRSRNQKELPYFTYSPSSSPSRSSASSDAGSDSGFHLELGFAEHVQHHASQPTNGLGLSLGLPSNQVSFDV